MKNYKRRALIVSQRYPLPEDHGNAMRTMNFVRFFKGSCNNPCVVDIAHTGRADGDQHSKYFDNEFVFKTLSSENGITRKLLRLVHRHPSPMFIFDGPSKKRFVTLVAGNNYDYILFRYVHTTQMAFSLPQVYKERTIVDIDDVPSANLYDMQFEKAVGIKRILAGLNRILLEQYEKKCISLGTSLFCSEDDRMVFSDGLIDNNHFVVPNVYSNEAFEKYDFGNGFDCGNVLLFVGALGYRPNIEGLQWFIKGYFNAFKDQYPDCRLMVVGRNPGQDIKKLCSQYRGIELYSNVPDIRPYYRKAKAVVVPLLSGGGTRIKILEAALSCRPVLSTPVGASGLELKDQREIHLFNTPDEFLANYGKLNRLEYYVKTVEQAEKVVKDCYSSTCFSDRMNAVLRRIDAKRS
jgi:glycosyltransferase involved in cell wall biosynthesis